jgi:hypothetical protein
MKQVCAPCRWRASRRASVPRSDGVTVLAGVGSFWQHAWGEFLLPVPPALPSLTKAGGPGCELALMPALYRSHGGSLTRAAFLSARRMLLQSAIIVAGL